MNDMKVYSAIVANVNEARSKVDALRLFAGTAEEHAAISESLRWLDRAFHLIQDKYVEKEV